jgi:hypothetical protein
VDVSVFRWTGTDPEKAYACASLNETVGVLSKNPQDSHALNCLGEFSHHKPSAWRKTVAATMRLMSPRQEIFRETTSSGMVPTGD